MEYKQMQPRRIHREMAHTCEHSNIDSMSKQNCKIRPNLRNLCNFNKYYNLIMDGQDDVEIDEILDMWNEEDDKGVADYRQTVNWLLTKDENYNDENYL